MPFGQHARIIDAGLDLLLTRLVLKESGFIVENWRASEHHAIGAVFG